MAAANGPVKCTPKQQELLIQSIIDRPKLAVGKLDPSFTNLDRKKGWEDVAKILNAEGAGPTKTAAKWNKCWNDYKCKVKGKAARIAKSRKITGGGEGTKVELTPLEERVVGEFLGNAAIFGDGEIDEAGVQLDCAGRGDTAHVEEIYLNLPFTSEVPEDSEVLYSEPVDVDTQQEFATQSEMTETSVPRNSSQTTTPVPLNNPTSNGKKRKRTHVTGSTLSETVQAAKEFASGQKASTKAMESVASAIEKQAGAMARIATALEKLVDVMSKK